MKKRILFVFIIIIFTSTFIFSIISSRIYYEKFLEDAKNNLYIYMNQYSEEFSWDVAGAKSYSRKLNGVRVTFIDKNGEVIGDSEENLPLDNHLNREEVSIQENKVCNDVVSPKLQGHYDIELYYDHHVFEIYINGGEYVMSQVVYDLNDQVIIQNTEYKVYVRSL